MTKIEKKFEIPANIIFLEDMEIKHDNLIIRTVAADIKEGYLHVCNMYANEAGELPTETKNSLKKACSLIENIMRGEIDIWNRIPLTKELEFNRSKVPVIAFIEGPTQSYPKIASDTLSTTEVGAILLDSDRASLELLKSSSGKTDNTLWDTFLSGKIYNNKVRFIRITNDRNLHTRQKAILLKKEI